MEKRTVTFKGAPLSLAGEAVQLGKPAPNARLVRQDLSTVELAAFHGQPMLLSVVPSLDTGVCAMQTKRFNEEAAKLADKVKILTVSMDLPFAQKRFCSAEQIDKVEVLSDHREASFGLAYGTLVEELRLLCRAVFLVDRHGVVRYAEYVPEITEHPNYQAALEAVRAVAAEA
mgnify:CR=1 FL=1